MRRKNCKCCWRRCKREQVESRRRLKARRGVAFPELSGGKRDGWMQKDGKERELGKSRGLCVLDFLIGEAGLNL